MSKTISFPFTFVNGRIATSEEPSTQLADHMVSVIGTQLGERIMRPNYGTNTVQFDFGSGDEIDRALLEQEAARAVSVWEPGAQAVTVTFDSSPDLYGNLFATISYAPSGDNVNTGIVTQTVLIGVLTGNGVVESGSPSSINAPIGASSNTRFFGVQE